MGIFSDVGLAIKHDAFESLPDGVQAYLKDCGNFDVYKTKATGDLLFHTKYIKFYVLDAPVSDLYDALDALPETDFLLLEACHDYPEGTENNRGDWDDNPWEMRTNVEVSVSFNDYLSTVRLQ
jgi:hypothetical protein